MDFGSLGLNGLVGLNTTTSTTPPTGLNFFSPDPETKQRHYGSGFIINNKQQDSSCINEDVHDVLRSSKLVKSDDFYGDKAMMLKQEQILSFSSSKTEETTPQNGSFPYFHLTSAYSRNPPGYNNNGGSRGLFTPSQWMELEHQALIYKYINANMPIPSHLLIPIRKAFESLVGFSSFPLALLTPNSYHGWGSFHTGFSNNTDPEPGRCRRTDGKKWRCSKDAVTDHKYCERHMNRGRQRSRKPVEGRSVTVSANATVKPKLSSVVVGNGGVPPLSSRPPLSVAATHKSNGEIVSDDGFGSSDTILPINRIFPKKDSPKENPFLIPKQHIPSHQGISGHEFGNISSHSLLNSSRETVSQNPRRVFTDDEWTKIPSDRSVISWPKVDTQSNRATTATTTTTTQLSISIPNTNSGQYVVTTSSTSVNDKVTLSPLKLLREFEPIQMGLGVGSNTNQPNQQRSNWVPLAWDTSTGGPLGEALHNTTGQYKNSSVLGLTTADWDNNSPRRGSSSPTGVLQKTAFGCLSNGSAGNSPRAGNRKPQ